jgi:hypothetical protein
MKNTVNEQLRRLVQPLIMTLRYRVDFLHRFGDMLLRPIAGNRDGF